MISFDHEAVTQKKKVLIFEDSFSLTTDLLKKWVEMAEAAVRRSHRFTVALSGGRSPLEFYCRLSSFKDFYLWKYTHIFIGDERFVPLDHDASNFKMIKENLLDFVPIPPENVHPVATDGQNVELCAEHYKQQLLGFFELNEQKMPCFDFILLGIGTDGHTASLFPEDPRIKDTERLVLPVSLPHLKHERVSLTLPVINSARHLVTIGLGNGKARMIQGILDGSLDVPASRVRPVHGAHEYFLDKGAASALPFHESLRQEGLAVRYDAGLS